MQLNTLLEEFRFQCQCRKLQPRTISNYYRQIGYFLKFAEEEKGITTLETVTPQCIKQFLQTMESKGRKPAYGESTRSLGFIYPPMYRVPWFL